MRNEGSLRPLVRRLSDGEVQRLVRPSRFAFRDRYGWPVERIVGRPITNVIRLILHTDIVQSCRKQRRMGNE